MYPRGQSDEELANNLAQFFINRISKIRTDLDGKNCDYRDHFPLKLNHSQIFKCYMIFLQLLILNY